MSLERSRQGKRRHSLLTTEDRYRARAKLKAKTRQAQGKAPKYRPTRIEVAPVDKEAEG